MAASSDEILFRQFIGLSVPMRKQIVDDAKTTAASAALKRPHGNSGSAQLVKAARKTGAGEKSVERVDVLFAAANAGGGGAARVPQVVTGVPAAL